MKRYTGNLVIELEDQNTGNVETVSETNMVTNAVNDILGVNPMGVMYKAGGEYDDSLTWNNELLPICPNMIGGHPAFSRFHHGAGGQHLYAVNESAGGLCFQ